MENETELKNFKMGTISYIAKTAGIKFEDQPETWYNPIGVELKEYVLQQLEKGMEVEILLENVTSHNFKTVNILSAGDKPIPEEKVPAQQTQSAKPIEAHKESTLQKDNIPSKFIMALQGKEFITHGGLLYMAHEKGLKSITTEMLDKPNVDGTIIFKATVIMAGGETFIAHGDANDTNTGERMKMPKIRMAETRAVNRALRFATNIGMCSTDELGEEKEAPK